MLVINPCFFTSLAFLAILKMPNTIHGVVVFFIFLGSGVGMMATMLWLNRPFREKVLGIKFHGVVEVGAQATRKASAVIGEGMVDGCRGVEGMREGVGMGMVGTRGMAGAPLAGAGEGVRMGVAGTNGAVRRAGNGVRADVNQQTEKAEEGGLGLPRGHGGARRSVQFHYAPPGGQTLLAHTPPAEGGLAKRKSSLVTRVKDGRSLMM